MRHVKACVLAIAAGMALGGSSSPAEAQVLQRLRQRAQQAVENAVNCAVGDAACIQKAQSEGKPVVVTDSKGKPLPEGEQAKALSGQPETPAQARPGEGAWANYDFVPGERVLFREEFTSERVGNFPRRLEFLNGNAEVVTWNDGRWLRVTEWAAFAVPLPETLPERFTIEFQMTVPWWGMILYGGPDGDVGEGQTSAGDKTNTFVQINCCDVGVVNARNQGSSSTDPRPHFKTGDEGIDGLLVNVRIQADGRYMKLYLNEVRLANFPNASFKRSDKLYLELRASNENPVMFSNISVNAGGKSMYDALMADGRFVTQGILFDVGSDRIKPESTPTLTEIVDMLKSHPELRLRVEGHTDNTGQQAQNQTLSEKRAAAVKAHLVSSGIDAARLESQGFGPGKPAASNDTPEGRQSNRRVELVRLD
jgi:OmpA-OmpF porin, OOP family